MYDSNRLRIDRLLRSHARITIHANMGLGIVMVGSNWLFVVLVSNLASRKHRDEMAHIENDRSIWTDA